MPDKSSGFPNTGTKHDLATSTVASRSSHTVEPVDHNETLAESHLSGSAVIAGPVTTHGSGNGGTHDKGSPTPPQKVHGGIPHGTGPKRDKPVTTPHKKPPKPGPPGAQGPPGETGAPGAPGTPGAPGGSGEEFAFVNGLGSDQNGEQQPNQQDNNQTSSGASPFVIVLLLIAIGAGVWFYMQHQKKSKGGESKGDRREGDRRKSESKEEKSE